MASSEDSLHSVRGCESHDLELWPGVTGTCHHTYLCKAGIEPRVLMYTRQTHFFFFLIHLMSEYVGQLWRKFH